MQIDELRNEKYSLQKALLISRKQYLDLQSQYLEYRRITQQQDEELKKLDDKESIYIQKVQLE